jgi:hypothetical protein
MCSEAQLPVCCKAAQQWVVFAASRHPRDNTHRHESHFSVQQTEGIRHTTAKPSAGLAHQQFDSAPTCVHADADLHSAANLLADLFCSCQHINSSSSHSQRMVTRAAVVPACDHVGIAYCLHLEHTMPAVQSKAQQTRHTCVTTQHLQRMQA